MLKTDQQVRAEYAYLVVQNALDFLKTKPTRARMEVENTALRDRLAAGGRKQQLGDDLCRNPGNVLGRCATAVHAIIYNMPLRRESE